MTELILTNADHVERLINRELALTPGSTVMVRRAKGYDVTHIVRVGEESVMKRFALRYEMRVWGSVA